HRRGHDSGDCRAGRHHGAACVAAHLLPAGGPGLAHRPLGCAIARADLASLLRALKRTRTMLDILVQGILLGGLYTLFALGQSLMFGVMRLTNTAQGDFIILGAFAVIAGTGLAGGAPFLVALAVLPLAFGF